MRILSATIFVTSILVGVASAQVISPAVEQPVVTRAVAPHFPSRDKSGYAVGSVIVEIQIDAGGVVIKAQAVQGHPLLFSASEKAAQRWLFAPAAETKVRTARLTFVFKIMDEDTTDEDLSPIFMPPYKIEVRRKVSLVERRDT
jgi:TonB family protein